MPHLVTKTNIKVKLVSGIRVHFLFPICASRRALSSALARRFLALAMLKRMFIMLVGTSRERVTWLRRSLFALLRYSLLLSCVWLKYLYLDAGTVLLSRGSSEESACADLYRRFTLSSKEFVGFPLSFVSENISLLQRKLYSGLYVGKQRLETGVQRSARARRVRANHIVLPC